VKCGQFAGRTFPAECCVVPSECEADEHFLLRFVDPCPVVLLDL